MHLQIQALVDTFLCLAALNGVFLTCMYTFTLTKKFPPFNRNRMKFSVFIHLLIIFLIISAKTFAQQGQWDSVTTHNAVNGRSECGMAASNGKLYLIGGDGMNAVEVFDPNTQVWTKKTAPPVPMNHFEAVAFNNHIYVLEAFEGGQFPNQPNLANVYIYDTQTDSWHTGSGLTPERRRAAAGAALYNGKLYLVDGIKHGHSSGTTNIFDVYDPATDQWTALPDAPHIRDHCEAAVVDNKLYVAGGRNTSFRDPNNKITFFSQTVLEVDCYDFISGKWSTLTAKLPMGTGGGSMVNLNGSLYYMGGERATETERNTSRKNTFYLNMAIPEKWVETDSLKLPRNGMSATVLNNKIYAFGGTGGPGGPPPGLPANQQTKDPVPMRPPPGGTPPKQDISPLEVFAQTIDLVEIL
jgi:N-acetylneuraminic acid mutarotase